MMQSRRHSFYETCTSTAIGFGVAVTAQAVVFPLFGIHTEWHENLGIAAIFTVISIVRGYCVRRLWNWWAYRNNWRRNRNKEPLTLEVFENVRKQLHAMPGWPFGPHFYCRCTIDPRTVDFDFVALDELGEIHRKGIMEMLSTEFPHTIKRVVKND